MRAEYSDRLVTILLSHGSDHQAGLHKPKCQYTNDATYTYWNEGQGFEPGAGRPSRLGDSVSQAGWDRSYSDCCMQ